jgi:hypothetical protein
MPKRTDTNQAEIVAALRQAGALVLDLHTVGRGVPDLLIYFRTRLQLVEVKRPGEKPNALQLAFHAVWPVSVVETIPEALALVGVRL